MAADKWLSGLRAGASVLNDGEKSYERDGTTGSEGSGESGEIAHKIWEESGRPAGQADSRWEQARQIVDGQNPDFVKHKPFVSSASMSKSKQPMEPVMRNFDEILADAQKAVELSLREAFETGKGSHGLRTQA